MTRQPSSRGSAPTSLAFLAVESSATPDHFDVRNTVHKWSKGAVAVERREDDASTRSHITVTESYDHIWSIIGERVDPSRPVHLFAYDLPLCLTLSRFWHLLNKRVVGVTRGETDFLPGKEPEGRKVEWEGIICDSDPPVIISVWHRRGGRIHMVDVRNYWRDFVPQSLDCESQVNEIRSKVKSLIWWHKKEKLGRWGPTVSSLALSAFKRHSKHDNSIEPSNCTHQRDLEREALYGGRCEVFRVGRDIPSVWQVDCNSLYPYVSSGLDVPISVRTEDALPWARRNGVIDGLQDCIARVRLSTDRLCYPVRRDDRLIYPVGEFNTTLAGPELEFAREHGHIIELYRVRRYNTAPIFDRYMEWQQETRRKAELDGDSDGVLFAKMLGNGLWGKFAQRRHKWESVSKHIDVPTDMQLASPDELRWYLWLTEPVQGEAISVAFGSDAKTLKLRRIGNHWQVKLPPGETESAFPAIAAWVTSAARLYMQMLIDIAGRDNVYHIATDALICNADAMEAFEDSGLLDDAAYGSLKTVVGPVDCEIVAPNWHRLGQSWTRAGLPSDAYEDKEGSWRTTVRESLETTLARGVVGTVNEREVRKWFVLSPGVGEIRDDGFVSPLVLPER